MTNREWLNSLSNEDFLRNAYIFCAAVGLTCNNNVKCGKCMMTWLQKEHEKVEVENENHNNK